ncbi:MAG: hypothetical protein KDC24_00300, partial [Saprospiraceae bacterium]|nr:hypothetical protein [Saprospiraceae bacterium]
MRELLITLSCLWALPFLAQNVPESSSEPTENSNKMAALHRQNMAVDTYFEKEEEKLKSKNTPGMADILVSVPAATEGFVIFKRQENGSIETSYVAGKKALLYARSYILNNKGAETETSKQNEKENITAKAPVQEAVNIIKSSIKLGKNLQSRYEQYKNGDRQERFQLVKDLIFGSGKKETKEESPA